MLYTSAATLMPFGAIAPPTEVGGVFFFGDQRSKLTLAFTVELKDSEFSVRNRQIQSILSAHSLYATQCLINALTGQVKSPLRPGSPVMGSGDLAVH